MKPLLKPNNLYDYQKEAVIHQLNNHESMLWLGVGLGKTPITLTSIVDRMRAGQVQKTLIIGPLRVIQAVWAREARKWEHTKHLRFSVIHGKPQQRMTALFRDADIYLINYENINWLSEQLTRYYLKQKKPLPFQMCVYDEITKMKNSTSLRVRGGLRDKKDKHGNAVSIRHIGWKSIAPHIPIKTGLTGSPAANGYLDLHGQFLVVDDGKRLGEFITHYKDSYFTSDYQGWNYSPTDLGKECIEQRISDITLKMDSNEYLDLPDCKVTNIMIDLPPKARKAYTELEEELFTALDNGTEIELFNKQSLSNKVLQLCNGAMYKESGSTEYAHVHDAKLDALEEVLEEAGGAPVLCSYTFTSDAERIMKRFKKYKPVNMTAEKSANTENIINKWNDGQIKLMIGHPASMGHGIDGLQESGCIIVWYGLNWSYELYEQFNGRINRNGQTRPVSLIRILCKDSIDLAVADAIEGKHYDQEGLKDSVQKYRSGRIDNELTPDFM